MHGVRNYEYLLQVTIIMHNSTRFEFCINTVLYRSIGKSTVLNIVNRVLNMESDKNIHI